MSRRVREIKAREELRPVASPVRTGYTSRDVASAGAAYSLAEALSGIQPSLNRFFTKRMEEQQKADIGKGASLYELQANRESWSDFVKKNPEYAKANPWIKEGYLRARMANEGENYRLWLQAQASSENAFVEVDGQKIALAEADADQTALWMQQQKQRYVQEKMGGIADPALFSEIFLPLSGNAERELASRIISYQQDVMWNRAISEHTQLMVNTLRGALEAGAFDGPEAEQAYQHLGAQITGMARELIKDGVPPQQINKAIVDALIAFADDNEMEDAELVLDVVKYIETSKGAFLGNIPGVKREIETAKDAIRQENYWKVVQQEQLRKMEQAELRRVDDTQIALAYIDNPLNVPKALRKQYIEKYGMEGYTDLIRNLRMMDSYNERPTGEGAEAAAVRMWYRIAMGEPPTPQEIIEAGMSKSETVSLLRTVANRDTSTAKTYAPVIQRSVFNSLLADPNPDKAPEEMQLFAFQVAQEAGVEMEKILRENPELANNLEELLIEARRVSLRTVDAYKPQMANYIKRAMADRSATLERPGFDIMRGYNPEQQKSVLQMAEEYVAKKNAGEDVSGLDFAKLVRARSGGNVTPEEVLETLKRGGK